MNADEARVGARVTWADREDEFHGPVYLPGEHTGTVTEVNGDWTMVAWDDGDTLAQHVYELQLIREVPDGP